MWRDGLWLKLWDIGERGGCGVKCMRHLEVQCFWSSLSILFLVLINDLLKDVEQA